MIVLQIFNTKRPEIFGVSAIALGRHRWGLKFSVEIMQLLQITKEAIAPK